MGRQAASNLTRSNQNQFDTSKSTPCTPRTRDYHQHGSAVTREPGTNTEEVDDEVVGELGEVGDVEKRWVEGEGEQRGRSHRPRSGSRAPFQQPLLHILVSDFDYALAEPLLFWLRSDLFSFFISSSVSCFTTNKQKHIILPCPLPMAKIPVSSNWRWTHFVLSIEEVTGKTHTMQCYHRDWSIQVCPLGSSR
jgi:hypothetical protein